LIRSGNRQSDRGTGDASYLPTRVANPASLDKRALPVPNAGIRLPADVSCWRQRERRPENRWADTIIDKARR